MRRIILAATLLAVSMFASALDFKRFYDRDAVVEGQGGEMEEIEGIDYWTNGDPPRRYEIIGYIEDRRHASVPNRNGQIKVIAPAGRANRKS